jgi:hypothetical protein
MKSSLLGSILAIVKVSKKKKKKQPSLLSHRIRKASLFFRASLSCTLYILSVLSATKNSAHASIHCEHHPRRKKEKKEKRETLKKI